ncbi:MAG: hypothetical protein AAB276_01000, partial [Pseudomonadota bacterium]
TVPSGPTACPAGYNSGYLIPGYTWNSSSGVCAYVAQSSTCTCNSALKGLPPVGAPVACNTLSGHSGETGWATPTYTFNAAPGTCAWVTSTWDTSGCTCDSTTEYVSALAHATTCTSCETETVPAVWKYKYNGPGCSRGPDYMTTPSVCQNKNFYWRLDGAGYSTFGAPSKGGNPEVNDGCSCAQWGASATSVCAGAAGLLWNVGNCNCGL